MQEEITQITPKKRLGSIRQSNYSEPPSEVLQAMQKVSEWLTGNPFSIMIMDDSHGKYSGKGFWMFTGEEGVMADFSYRGSVLGVQSCIALKPIERRPKYSNSQLLAVQGKPFEYVRDWVDHKISYKEYCQLPGQTPEEKAILLKDASDWANKI